MALVRAALLLCSAATAAPAAAPERLRCEHAPAPLIGLDVAAPRFSWVVPPTAGAYGEASAGYQVQVIDEPAAKTVWDSGRVASPASSVVYSGPPLAADKSFAWRVRVDAGEPSLRDAAADSGWSEPYRFRTAPSATTWSNASWIDGSRGALRRSIALPTGHKLVEAFVFASSIGFHHVKVNGALLGNQSTYLFEPGQSAYS